VAAGPTGSGKSELALYLAERLSGEIVNCDSLQLYRGFDIGTAKPPPAARRGIPHHLFDVLEPQTVYSAGAYARQARAVIADISARGRLPIVVGGTGFYLRALLDGLPALPSRDEGLRARLQRAEQRRPGLLLRLLRRWDPAAAARIHPADRHKLIRATEIAWLTRGPLPPPNAAQPLAGYEILQFGLDPPREALAAVLAERTRRMFAAGLIEEVRALLAAGLTGEEKPFESLGYKQALAHVRGALSREAAIESTLIETRQYAKRQRTWFRRDARIQWLAGFGYEPHIQAAALERAVRLVAK
jgi:tRNA dimethylallyltransferase